MKRALVSMVFLAACGPQEAQVGSSQDPVGASLAAPLAASEFGIAFRSDWNIVRNGIFTEGGTIRVQYDAARLPGCRGEQNGKPAWSITGYAQVNDGPVQSFEAGGFSPSSGTSAPVVQLPAAGKVAFWFNVTNVWGCSEWDSNFGHNFVYEVAPQPRIVFDAAWSETVVGTPGSNPTLVVDYDLSRLPDCRATYSGLPTWEILVWWRFDGGATQYTPVTVAHGSERVAAPARIAIPTGAKEIELWFKSSDRGGCVQYDSDFGSNYRWHVN
ncbi:MAG: hypothetical protein IPJ65_33425 [Archangiaceae bacterium]|nr:hypothetical protein [Archangiaceae bacterium]